MQDYLLVHATIRPGDFVLSDRHKSKISAQPRRRVPVGAHFPRVSKSELTIGDVLGAGATAVVHSCTYLNAPRAVKLFNVALLRDKNFRRELSIAPYLQHPNIVRLYALVVETSPASDQNSPDVTIVGLLMERMDLSLTSYLQQLLDSKAEMDLSVALPWALDMGSAILFAHLQRVIHLDIKPDNILLDNTSCEGPSSSRRLVAKLTDFGSACAISRTTTLTMTATRGTPLYIAPEYAAAETGPTTACDVFSFGMTLWSMLHPKGDPKVPTNGVQIGRWLDKGNRPEIAPKYAGNGIGDLIARCWDGEALRRPSMREVLLTLMGLCSPSPLTGQHLALQKIKPLALQTLNRLDLIEPWSALEWVERDKVQFSNSLTDITNPLFQYVQKLYGNINSAPIQRIVMVQSNRFEMFLQIHTAEQESRALNPVLRLENFDDPDSIAAINKLKQSFVDPVPPGTEPPLARIVFGWHGTDIQHIESICRDGPRNLRTTDSGYFGSGSYFALEAAYAQRYSQYYPPNSSGEYAVILFLVSVSHAYPVTLDRDYRSDGDPNVPSNKGYSNFYSDDPTQARSLRPCCEHFIPVKDYGCTNPITGQKDISTNYDFQACPESSAEAHELVIETHLRCSPYAIIYFKLDPNSNAVIREERDVVVVGKEKPKDKSSNKNPSKENY